MTENNPSPSGSSKRALIIAGSLIAALAVVYFSFFYPPVSTGDTEGTIGAVKKYRAEQITEKDVVLEGMTSMNIEAVNQAMQQTGAKLAESAREAAKAAEGLLASARKPEAQAFAEGMKMIASKAEALKADSRNSYSEAAAIALAAKEQAAKVDAMAAEARTSEFLRAQDGLKALEKSANGVRDLGVRVECMKLSNEARELAVKAEGVRVEGKAVEWGMLAESARALAVKAEGLKEFGRQEEAIKFVDGAKTFERYAAAARANASGRQPEALKAAVDAAKVMAGRAELFARPVDEARKTVSE